jgi:hypothetical protein
MTPKAARAMLFNLEDNFDEVFHSDYKNEKIVYRYINHPDGIYFAINNTVYGEHREYISGGWITSTKTMDKPLQDVLMESEVYITINLGKIKGRISSWVAR